jgi:tetratricopeptide (TPR) repeat protein
MAKGKKKTVYRPAAGFGMKQVDLSAQIRRVARLFAEGDEQQAYQQAWELCQRYPDRAEPHELLAEICLELEEMNLYGKACAKLMEFQPHHADHAYGFASAMLHGRHPLLAWQTMQKVIALKPSDPDMIEGAQTLIAAIEQGFDDLLLPAGDLSREAAIEMLILHEYAQLYLNWGEYDKCREQELQCLQIKPDMLSAMNNLSLVAFMQDDLAGAIAQSEQVLTIEPDNIHALSNLVRYCILQGEAERAKAFATRLKDSQADAWDPWTKKFEGLSYIGDDAAIVTLWKQLKRQKEEQESLPAMACHLAAVALARQGDIEQATKLWNQALAEEPNLQIAQDNLTNIFKPNAERHLAWPFKMDAWMTHQMQQDMKAELVPLMKASNQQFKKVSKQYFQKHPESRNWAKIMLDRGDPLSCGAIVDLIKNADIPELWEILREFALGQSGSEQARYQAAIALVQAEKLDPEKVRLWMQGNWQEVSLINYEFHDEPPYKHSRKVQQLLARAIPLLRTGTKDAAITAEKLFQQALAEKVSPDILNNIAVAYQLQERRDEAMALFQQIITDYPDYVPSRVAVAYQHLKHDEIDAADALLKPVLKRHKFHFDDFDMFSDVYLELLWGQEQIQGAKAWLQMWEQISPGHHRITAWKERLEIAGLAEKIGSLATKGKRSSKLK